MRSTTPPLFYRRPEGVPVSYYTAKSAKEERPALCVQPHAASQHVYTTSASTSRVGSVDASACAPPSSCINTAPLVAPVTNPFNFVNPQQRFSAVNEDPAEFLQHSAARWSTTANQCGNVLATLDAQEASLLLEEQAARAKLAELQLTRKRQTEELSALSHGLEVLLDREERYFTEPLVDFFDEIAAREQQCALLQDQLQQAEAHLETLCRKHQLFDAVVEEKESLERELQRVQDGFLAIDRRRMACRMRAERLFDVESKRAFEAARHAREIDTQLKEMTRSGPLAEGWCTQSSRSVSRGVTFAKNSIALDVGSRAGDDDEEEEEEDGAAGLTQCIEGSSVCLRDDDEENDEDVAGISGTSAVYSLNVPKRTRIEVPTA